jgi:hypothetical protein
VNPESETIKDGEIGWLRIHKKGGFFSRVFPILQGRQERGTIAWEASNPANEIAPG